MDGGCNTPAVLRSDPGKFLDEPSLALAPGPVKQCNGRGGIRLEPLFGGLEVLSASYEGSNCIAR